MSRPDDEDFLSRWSSRKLKARAEVPAPELIPLPDEPAGAAPAEGPGKTDAEILAELGLPDPETLVKGDDFRAFLAAAVPPRLRARALRRLWVSDPVLANLDGLNDYEGDFTAAATVRPDLKTAYRVGKGMLRDLPQAGTAAADSPRPAAEEDRAEPLAEPEAATPAAEAEADADPPAGSGGELASGGDAPSPAGASPRGESTAAAGRPRRMRFRFEAG